MRSEELAAVKFPFREVHRLPPCHHLTLITEWTPSNIFHHISPPLTTSTTRPRTSDRYRAPPSQPDTPRRPTDPPLLNTDLTFLTRIFQGPSYNSSQLPPCGFSTGVCATRLSPRFSSTSYSSYIRKSAQRMGAMEVKLELDELEAGQKG